LNFLSIKEPGKIKRVTVSTKKNLNFLIQKQKSAEVCAMLDINFTVQTTSAIIIAVFEIEVLIMKL